MVSIYFKKINAHKAMKYRYSAVMISIMLSC